MKLHTLAILSAAALSLTMIVPEPAEAHYNGYRHRHRSHSAVAGPLYETRTPRGVVRERQYGNCYVRNVTRYNRYGQRVVKRTKYC
jgi:hypothetical protein